MIRLNKLAVFAQGEVRDLRINLPVAYAQGDIHDPEKLKWWNWKD